MAVESTGSRPHTFFSDFQYMSFCSCCTPGNRLDLYTSEAINGSIDGVTDLARYAKTAPKKIPSIYDIFYKHMTHDITSQKYQTVCNITYAIIELVKQCPHALSYLENRVITTVTKLLRKAPIKTSESNTPSDHLYPYLAYMLVYLSLSSFYIWCFFSISSGIIVLYERTPFHIPISAYYLNLFLTFM